VPTIVPTNSQGTWFWMTWPSWFNKILPASWI
jgi:hypothetical protein